MSVITIWIDENNKTIKQSAIDHQVSLNQTPQDQVIIKYTSQKLPNGIAVTKQDALLEHVVAKDPELAKDVKVMEKVANESRFIRKQAFYSRDRSLTHGEKPITKFTNITEADPVELKEARRNERNLDTDQ